MPDISKQELKTKSISGFFWRFSERLASHLVMSIVTIVLARLLLPDDFGVVALAMVFVNIANVFVVSGLNTSLIQKKEIEETDCSTIFYATLLLSIVLYAIIFVSSPLIADIYDNSKVTNLLRVLGLFIPLSTFNSIQQAMVSRNLDFKKIFIATLCGALLAGCIGIGLALAGFGAWALVGQQLSSVFFNTITLSFIIRWKPKLIFSIDRFKNLFRFGTNLMFANFIGSIFNQLRNFLVGLKYTPSDLAYFTTGDMFPVLITNNVDVAINSVLFPAMSKIQDNLDEVKQAMRRSMMTSSYILVPSLLILAAVADKLVLVLLTEKWMFCVPYIQILSIGYCFSTLGSANLQSINAIGRSDVTLKLEFFKKTIFILIIISAAQVSPLMIAAGASLYNLIATLINLYPNKKLINYSIGSQLKDVMPQFLLSIAVALFVFILGRLPIHNLLCLVIQIVVGVLAYWGASYLLSLESFLYIRQTVSEIRARNSI